MACSLLATVQNEYPSQKILDSKIPIVDIRTPSEWKESGLLQNALPIMFFDARGNYNVELFLKQLQSQVDVSKPFALVCRTGSRTKVVAHFLSQEFGYQVIDLQGGMLYIKAKKLPILPYKK